MRKLYLLSFLFSFFTLGLFAQSMMPGNVMLDAGIGFGAYGTEFKSAFGSNKDGAAPVYLDLNARIAISERIALGINLDQGSYLRDEEDKLTDPGTYTYGKYTAAFRFLFSNKDMFQFFGDLNLGYTSTQFSGSSFDKASGFIYQLNGGFNVYFTTFMGLYLSAGYSSYAIKGDYNFANTEFTWTFKGVDVQTGLTFKF